LPAGGDSLFGEINKEIEIALSTISFLFGIESGDMGLSKFISRVELYYIV
jgi:hypothetical protein